jgi:WhiB family redox-sensing transcriptional regulator
MIERPEWQDKAECRGTVQKYGSLDLFYEEAHYKKAIEVCSFCEVRPECREYAIENGIFDGVWGGMTPRERQRLAWRAHRAKFRR